MSDADELRRIAQNDYQPVAWGKYLPDGELLLAIADRLEKGPSPAIPKKATDMSDADELRRIAQNDYMIDGKYLPDGWLLLTIADRLEKDEVTECQVFGCPCEHGEPCVMEAITSYPEKDD